MLDSLIAASIPMISITVIVILLGLFAFWLWALIDCIQNVTDTNEKLLWTLIIVFLTIIGAFLYVFIGRQQSGKVRRMNKKRLYRNDDDKVLAGVSSGLGEYFNVDPVIIRLIWVLLAIISFGSALLAYIIAALIIPKK